MSDAEVRKKERVWNESQTDEAALDLMKTATRHGNTNYAGWLRWLGGHWTLNHPKKPGIYLRATREGEVLLPTISVWQAPDGRLIAHGSGSWATDKPVDKIWKGYWWSEPRPELLPPSAEQLAKDQKGLKP